MNFKFVRVQLFCNDLYPGSGVLRCDPHVFLIAALFWLQIEGYIIQRVRPFWLPHLFLISR